MYISLYDTCCIYVLLKEWLSDEIDFIETLFENVKQ